MYDVIVIGAGGMGASAAYQLTLDGKRVLLLEQFQVGHTRGSSHGGSRIIRYMHETAEYASLMPATIALWREIEAAAGEELMRLTGGLYIGPPDDPFLIDCAATLQRLKMPFRTLNAMEIRHEFPQFNVPDHWQALHEENSGILAASRCVAAMVRLATARGATLLEEAHVTQVTPLPDGVQVTYRQGGQSFSVEAAQAVICAGPWAAQFLTSLVSYTVPLQVTHQQVGYFQVHDPKLYSSARCPVFIFVTEPHGYGFPIFERPGLIKLARELFNDVVDPDDAARGVDEKNQTKLGETVVQMLNGVNPAPVQMDICLYTETPTRDFVIDRHPLHPQILIAAGFSGRGFKFVSGVGRLLADLAATPAGVYSSPFWRNNFRIDRFADGRPETLNFTAPVFH